jgi:hypothetical protein
LRNCRRPFVLLLHATPIKTAVRQILAKLKSRANLEMAQWSEGRKSRVYSKGQIKKRTESRQNRRRSSPTFDNPLHQSILDKRLGAPACPGMPWGLAFETWAPPRKGQSSPSLVQPSFQGTVGYGMGFWWMIIHDVPNLSLSMLKRKAKNVSSIGMKISPPSASRA